MSKFQLINTIAIGTLDYFDVSRPELDYVKTFETLAQHPW